MVDEFLRYVSNYDEEREPVRVKRNHSLRVRNIAMDLALKSGFNDEEIELAGIIGLLHDIGRFEQDKIFGSFDTSKTLDHAELGADILFKEGHIVDYTNKKKWYSAIEFAIRNHNKLTLRQCDDELSMKMGKLIRDADKIDIIYLYGTLGDFDLQSDDSEVSEEIKKYFDKKLCVNRKDINTHNDSIAATLAFGFEVNYDASIERMRDYLKNYYNRVERDGKFESVFNKVMEYLEERKEKSC